MNTNNKLLSLFLLSLVVLTACAAPLPQEQSDQTQKPTNVITDAESSGMISRYGSNMSCDLLKDELSRNGCFMQVNEMIGNMLESEIRMSFDMARCKELPGEVAVNCEKNLTQTGVKGPVSTEDQLLFQEIMRGKMPEPTDDASAGLLLPVYEDTKCSELKTEGLQAYCEKQISDRMDGVLMDQIIQSQDVTRCEELKDAQRQETCKLLMAS